MLGTVYTQVLDMTLGASLVILIVLAARLALKGAPKAFSYALWAVVLFRLLCPPALQAPLSVGPQVASVTESCTLIREDISPLGATEAAYRAIGDALNGGLGIQHIRTTGEDAFGNTVYVTSMWWDVWVLFGQYVWLAGAALQALRWGRKYLRLRRVLRAAVPGEDGVWLADHISSPFVMGLLRPRIYLPSGLTPAERRYVLAHERYHISRLDHVVKMLFFGARCIHWFNPLVWIAFRQFEKDMEMRCDEAVIRQLGREVRGNYAASLLRFTAGCPGASGMPLAFGEGDVKERILNMANWKEPGKRIRALAALFCAVILLAGAVLCGCGKEKPGLTGGIYKMETAVETLIQPRISFDMEENWFVFSYDPLSSFLSAGPFEIEDGMVTATTYYGHHTYTFEIVDSETIRYVQGNNLNLMTMEGRLAVPDGALFKFSADYTQEVYGNQEVTCIWPECEEPGCTDPAHSEYICLKPDCTDTACTNPVHHRDIYHSGHHQ